MASFRNAVVLAVWTAMVAAIAGYSWHTHLDNPALLAEIEAQAHLSLNIDYRRVLSRMGGLYAQADKVAANPYLTIPYRDVTTTDGASLTLVNPAYLNRLVFASVASRPDAIINKITSLRPTNPSNAPDAAEIAAMQRFTAADDRHTQTIEIGGKPYFRLMKPFMTEASCLKCHAKDGYREGDLRGAISISVPLTPFIAAQRAAAHHEVSMLGLLWLVGTSALLLFFRTGEAYEANLRRSEEKFRLLSESAASWESWRTNDGRFAYVSPSAQRITGYPPEQFIDNPDLLASIVHPDDREAWQRHAAEATTAKENAFEFRIIHRDGQEVWILHNCAPIVQSGSILGRRLSHTDITDRKILEQQLRQSQKMEAVGLLAGGIAHDFNNLLAVMLGYTELLAERGKGDPSLERPVKQIRTAIDKASALTQRLLTFSRRSIVQARVIDVSDAAQSAIRLLQRLLGEHIDIRLTTAEGPLPIRIDPIQFEQIILNLATNARDAMPKGGLLTISCERAEIDEQFLRGHGYGRTGTFALLALGDTGTGMSDKVREHLFEPFFTTKEPGKGTGLGLSIVFGIVKQCHGFIHCDSELGKGTVFRIYLPLHEGSAEPKVEEIVAPVRNGTETILLAEDDQALRELDQHVLERRGYKVLLARDGIEAVEAFTTAPARIDLLVFDVVMPRMGGREAFARIRAQRPDVRILFRSGYAKDLIAEQGLLSAEVQFLEKPTSAEILLRRVREILDTPKR